MITVTPQMRVLLAVEPVDFRCGIDGLARTCRKRLQADPFTGTVFVFRNKQLTAIKCLVYDSRAFWLCHMRLSEGRLRWWPEPGTETSAPLLAQELQVLLCGGDPTGINILPAWRPILDET